MKKLFKRASNAAVLLAANASAVFAQTSFKEYQSADQALNQVTTSMNSVVRPIFNIVSAVLGLVFIIYLIWNIAQQQKGNPQAQDALMKIGGGLLGAIVLLQVIKLVFFN